MTTTAPAPGLYVLDDSRGRKPRARTGQRINLLTAVPAADCSDVAPGSEGLEGWFRITYHNAESKYPTERLWIVRAEHLTPVVSLFSDAS